MLKLGIHPKVDRSVYYSTPGANFSTLKNFAKTPAHARERMIHPPAPTAAMEFGTAVHLAVLEPERFDAECAVAPKVDRRTKDGRAEWAVFEAENAGKILLAQDDYTRCEAMRDAVWAHPTAMQLLGGAGHTEVAVVWEHADPAIRCKGLIDRMAAHVGYTFVVDLKTCKDASPAGFSRAIATYWLHAQAAMYLDGCDAISPRPRRVAWIAAETAPPYCVAVYEPTGDTLELGRRAYQRWLEAYQRAKETETWPGYSSAIEPIELPRWAMIQGGMVDE